VCRGVGESYNHSRLYTISVSVSVLKYSGVVHGFAGAATFAVNASYSTYKNTATATTETMLPNELTAFQPANPSG
jgi:hypothetical protein